MKWEKSIIALSDILENPFCEKGYESLKKYYDANNMKYESECIEFLIEKIKNATNTNIGI
jgi:hypothetical protein